MFSDKQSISDLKKNIWSNAGLLDPRCPIKGLKKVRRKIAEKYKEAGVPDNYKVTTWLPHPLFDISRFQFICSNTSLASIYLLHMKLLKAWYVSQSCNQPLKVWNICIRPSRKGMCHLQGITRGKCASRALVVFFWAQTILTWCVGVAISLWHNELHMLPQSRWLSRQRLGFKNSFNKLSHSKD